MEIKVGYYVRTKYYGISKILDISNETTTNYCFITLDRFDSFGRLGVYVTKDKIIKSSPNIIDLIEVGDYVNGNKVLEKEDYLLWVFDNEKQDTLYYNEEDIKSIVTKEQFKSMEYKVGD